MQGSIIVCNGVYKTHNTDNKLHSFNGFPAHINATGSKYWYQNDKRHNDDRDADGKLLPAQIHVTGSKYWYQNGKFHNDDRDTDGMLLPAIIYNDGSKSWYQNGKRHNDDRDADGKLLPAIVRQNGSKEYYINGIQTDNIPPPKLSDNIHSTDTQTSIKKLLPALIELLKEL